MNELAYTKSTILSATTEADKTTRLNKNINQYNIQRQIWTLKSDLATNRSAIHTALLSFAATI